LFKVVLLLCNVDALARVIETLIQKLETRFLDHGVMDALGIVYPQHWLQVDYETFSPKHFAVIKITFYSNKTQLLDGVETFVLEVFNVSDLDSQ
jgi:hypothetical protein